MKGSATFYDSATFSYIVELIDGMKKDVILQHLSDHKYANSRAIILFTISELRISIMVLIIYRKLKCCEILPVNTKLHLA